MARDLTRVVMAMVDTASAVDGEGGDGLISMTEMQRWLSASGYRGPLVSWIKARMGSGKFGAVFSAWDKNGDGRIDKREMRGIVEAFLAEKALLGGPGDADDEDWELYDEDTVPLTLTPNP